MMNKKKTTYFHTVIIISTIMISILIGNYLHGEGEGKKTARIRDAVFEGTDLIPYEQQKVLDPDLNRGKIRTVQEGQPGLISRKYLVRRENGIETFRVVIEEKTILPAKAEIVALGTKGAIIVSSRSSGVPRRIIKAEATAYTHTGNPTFTGIYPRIGTIAVDPSVIPLGSKMWIEEYGYGIAQDTGGLIKGNTVDLFMNTKEECLRWGRRNVNIYILE